jgi:protein-tyrosine-phosphatase
MKSILFVCSANQCRSPMAEVLFKDLVRERGEADDWRVESAGVWAYAGAQATDNAQRAMMERGLDLSGHRSQPATNDLLSQFDLVIVMTREHEEALLEQMPELDGRIFLLRELVGEKGDFEDPVGGSLDVYRYAADELKELLTESYQTIKKQLPSAQAKDD